MHDSLVTGFDPKTGTVSILDPNPDTKNRRTYPLVEILERMSGVYGKKTGVVVLETTSGE
ncbi:MAG: hypothetical protein QMC36_03100 [Patescibacteria group bacterium]